MSTRNRNQIPDEDDFDSPGDEIPAENTPDEWQSDPDDTYQAGGRNSHANWLDAEETTDPGIENVHREPDIFVFHPPQTPKAAPHVSSAPVARSQPRTGPPRINLLRNQQPSPDTIRGLSRKKINFVLAGIALTGAMYASAHYYLVSKGSGDRTTIVAREPSATPPAKANEKKPVSPPTPQTAKSPAPATNPSSTSIEIITRKSKKILPLTIAWDSANNKPKITIRADVTDEKIEVVEVYEKDEGRFVVTLKLTANGTTYSATPVMVDSTRGPTVYTEVFTEIIAE